MIMFWVAAALLSAAAASFIIFRSARSAAIIGEDSELAAYRRQLREIDDLSDRGLLPEDQRRSVRAEAARRLLAAADHVTPAARSRLSKRWIAGAAALIPLIALGLYLAVGAPGAPDQPFSARAAAWRAADPNTLDPAKLVVVLEAVARAHPNDAEPLYFLARFQFAANDPFSAERSLRRALVLAPRRADLWGALGEALAAETEGSAPSDDARRAFAQAAALDPAAPAPRYFLARDKIASGDVKGGLAALRALRDSLVSDDPRRAGLDQEIAALETSGRLATPAAPAAATTSSATDDQKAFIAAMVARLAARLAAAPDDPAGWARLIQSYRVLGDTPQREAASARAHALFKGRPDALRLIDQANETRP